MAGLDVLEDLSRAGLKVWAESGKLIVEPASRLTPELRERITANREALLADAIPPLDYTATDLAELDQLIVAVGDPTGLLLALRKCMAPVNVRPNLEAFRTLARRQELERRA